MFIGTPILAITEDTGPLGHEVAENGLGLVVPWSQVDRLTNELDAFRLAPERFEELQTNCVRRAQAYDRDFAIDKFESLLQDLHCSTTIREIIVSIAVQRPGANRVTRLITGCQPEVSIGD